MNHPLGPLLMLLFFSFELSKTISVGWGGILIVNNSKLFDSADLFYNSVVEKTRINIFKDVFQTLVSSICHSPSFYFFGKYIIYSFFRIGLFRFSTTDEEINLNFNKGFIFKLNYPFTYLAAHQLSRIKFITEKCNSNYNTLRSRLFKNGYILPDKSSNLNDSIFVTPSRISILIGSKNKFIEFFNSNNIEVGLWFDGPLSPLPIIDDFKYNRLQYPEACYAADHIVNLPCHSRFKNCDLKKIGDLIEKFAKNYPELVVPKSY
jgi:dTDP-4-amino-4,6-dideoxygalactose transaminase